MRISNEELANRYSYHPPQGDQQVRYEQIRSTVRVLAQAIVELTPWGREQATALTKLDEVMFFANASIARGE